MFKILKDMPSGSHTQRVTITRSSLKRVSQINVKFIVPDVGSFGGLSLNFADIEPLLEEYAEPLQPDPLSPPAHIRFNMTWQESDLVVSSVTARTTMTSLGFIVPRPWEE